MEEIINENRCKSIIPNNIDIIKLWSGLLNGLYALIEACQYHGNITTKNVLFKNGIYMLSDPLYYYKNYSSSSSLSSTSRSVIYHDDIYCIAKIILEYVSPVSGNFKNEDLSIDKSIIELLNGCLNKKITTFQPLFSSSLFLQCQKGECIILL